MAKSRGFVPKSPIPKLHPDDLDPVYGVLNTTSAFPTRSTYGKHEPSTTSHTSSNGRSTTSVRLSPIPSPHSVPKHHAHVNSSMDQILLDMLQFQGVEDDEDPREFHFEVSQPRRKSMLSSKLRTGDSIAKRSKSTELFKKATFRQKMHHQLGQMEYVTEFVAARDPTTKPHRLSPSLLGLTDTSSAEQAPSVPVSPQPTSLPSSSFNRESRATTPQSNTTHSALSSKSFAKKRVASIEGLRGSFDTIATVSDDRLTPEATMLIREAVELRELEEQERLQHLALLDRQVTSLKERMRYEDFVVVRRQFYRYAVEETLRLNKIPKAGWLFCGKIISGVTARKMDKDHSGSLDFFEVLRYLYPHMSYQDVQRSIATFEKRYKSENKERATLTLHRMGSEPINDFARAFLSGFPPHERHSVEKPKRLTREMLRVMVTASSELVPHADFDRIYNVFSKERDGVRFLDLECFVSALYTFPREWGDDE